MSRRTPSKSPKHDRKEHEAPRGLTQEQYEELILETFTARPSPLQLELEELKRTVESDDSDSSEDEAKKRKSSKSPKRKSPLATGVKMLMDGAAMGMMKGVIHMQKISPSKIIKQKGRELGLLSPHKEKEESTTRQRHSSEHDPTSSSQSKLYSSEGATSSHTHPQFRKKLASPKGMFDEDVVDTKGKASKSKTSQRTRTLSHSQVQSDVAKGAQALGYHADAESSDGNAKYLPRDSSESTSQADAVAAAVYSPKRITQRRYACDERLPDTGRDTVDFTLKEDEQSCHPTLKTIGKELDAEILPEEDSKSPEDLILKKSTTEKSRMKTVASQTSLPEQPIQPQPAELPASPELVPEPSDSMQDKYKEFYVSLNKLSDTHEKVLKLASDSNLEMDRTMRKTATYINALIRHYREKDTQRKSEIEDLRKEITEINNAERKAKKDMETLKDMIKKISAAFNDMVNAM